MLLVTLGICIAVFIVGMVIYCKSITSEEENVAIGMLLVSGFVGVVVLIATIAVGAMVVNESVLDDKIAMYTEENTAIEQQIAECVERYQEYEQGVFEKVSPTDAVAVVTLYPELKSDTLVQAQIETYVENNNMIKQLKEKKIDASVRKWWLYFGGNNG